MAAYIALRIESGKMNYNDIFAYKLFKQFQETVDTILTADGYVVQDDGMVKQNEVL